MSSPKDVAQLYIGIIKGEKVRQGILFLFGRLDSFYYFDGFSGEIDNLRVNNQDSIATLRAMTLLSSSS